MCLYLRALIAQSVEHGANNARVVGSSPTGSIFYFFYLFFLMTIFSLLSFYFFFLSLSLYWLYVFPFFFFIRRGLSSVVEQLTPDQPVSGSIPLVLTFLSLLYMYERYYHSKILDKMRYYETYTFFCVCI